MSIYASNYTATAIIKIQTPIQIIILNQQLHLSELKLKTNFQDTEIYMEYGGVSHAIIKT